MKFIQENCFFLVAGIDGPAAFLNSEGPDLGMKIQILSVSQPQSPSFQTQPQHQPPPRSPVSEETERDGDTETLLEPKMDIHEMLQKQGEFFTQGPVFCCRLFFGLQ